MVITLEDYRRQLTVDIQNYIQEYILASSMAFKPEVDCYSVDIDDIAYLIRIYPDLFIRDLIKSVAEHKVYKCSICGQLRNKSAIKTDGKLGICSECHVAQIEATKLGDKSNGD